MPVRLRLTWTREFSTSGVGQSPVRRCPRDVSFMFTHAQHVDKARVAQVGEEVPDKVGRPVQMRGDLLVCKRAELLQKFQDCPRLDHVGPLMPD